MLTGLMILGNFLHKQTQKLETRCLSLCLCEAYQLCEKEGKTGVSFYVHIWSLVFCLCPSGFTTECERINAQAWIKWKIRFIFKQ